MINLSSVRGLVALGKTIVVAHRSELLLGASITSTIGAVVLAAKGGYEARGKVDEAERQEGRQLTVQEKANLTWHCYWPAAAASLTAVGSTSALHIVHVKEKKQLAAAALMTIDEIKRDAQKAIDEHVGPLDKSQQEQAVEEKAKKNKDGIAKMPNTDGEIEELFLVRDPITGRDIWSNTARINSAMVDIGNLINGQKDASLNDFYDEAKYGRVRQGDHIGWSGVIPEISWNDENGMPITGVRDDGRPWRGFRFLPAPDEDFRD